MTTTPHRGITPGLPTNTGSFKATERAESGLALLDAPADHDARNWGSVNVREGSRTPWGSADSVNYPADGIASVSTPGHGGIKLSPERNAEIPAALRSKSGWYEEDCESYIVAMFHPEAFPRWDPRKSAASGEDYGDMTQEQAIADYAESKVIDWFPDAYEKATGKTVTPAMSYTRAQQQKQQNKEAFRAEHANEFVTLGNGDIHATWIPKGYAACEARMDATGETRTFLMPRDEVVKDGMYGNNALVDPNRHLDVTDIVNARPSGPSPYASEENERTHDLGLRLESLTEAQRERARKELDKVWRFPNDDGTFTTESLGEHFARVGLVGKRQSTGDSKFYVQYGASRVHEVSKATYDALGGVEDTATEIDRARLAVNRAQAKAERADKAAWHHKDGFAAGREKALQAKAELDAARQVVKRLDEEQSAKGRAWQAEREQIQRDAFARLLAEKGIESL